MSSRKPPCRYFQQGKCRNGNRCQFPHVYDNNNSGGNGGNGGFGANNGANILKKEVERFADSKSLDLREKELKDALDSVPEIEIAIVTSAMGFGFPATENLISGRDYSFEESRWDFHQSQQRNALPQYEQQLNVRSQDMKMCIDELRKDSRKAARYSQVTALGKLNDPNQAVKPFLSRPLDLSGANLQQAGGAFGAQISTGGAFGVPTPSSSSFGSANNKSNPFGTQSSNPAPFGSTTTPTAGGDFGSQSLGSTSSGFGTSGFGASNTTSGFGSAPLGSTNTTAAFGTSGFGSTSTSTNPFGTSTFGSTPTASTTTPFGGANTTTTPAFGSSSLGSSTAFGSSGFGTSGFGVKPATTGASTGFGASSTSPFGALASNQPKETPFGQASTNASPFGQAPTNASPFGQTGATKTPFGSTGFGQSSTTTSSFGSTGFGQQATTSLPFGQSTGFGSSFGNMTNNNKPSGNFQPMMKQSGMEPDRVDVNDLSDAVKKQFEADHFTLGLVPEIEPPLVYC